MPKHRPEISAFFHAGSNTWTYLVSAGTGPALLIDPVKSELNGYLQLLRELDLRLEQVIETHIHADHVTAAGSLRTATGCRTLLGEPTPSECVSATFREGDRLNVGNLTLQVMYTPALISRTATPPPSTAACNACWLCPVIPKSGPATITRAGPPAR